MRELVSAEPEAERARQALLTAAEELSGCGSWAWRLSDNQIVWSENMYRIFGLTPGQEMLDPQSTPVSVHPDDQRRVEGAMERARRGDAASEIRYRICTETGAVRFVHAVMALKLAEEGDPVLVGWLRDITDAQHAEREIAAHVAVSEALGSWNEFQTSAERLLARLAESLGLSRGVIWVPAHGLLVPRASWERDDPASLRQELKELRLKPGEGLAGLVWEAAEPRTFLEASDQAEYPFQESARRSGIRGGVALPIIADGAVVAVIGLAGGEELELTERLKATLVGIGYEIGAVLAHRLAALTDSTLSARELEVLQLATEGNSGPDIAERLGVSPATVKSHFENIYAKFEVFDRASAVAKAIRQGLIR